MLAFTAFLAWSCLKEVEPGDAQSGYGGIELRLDSSNSIRVETKTLTPEEELLEGLRFDNVLVILVNNSGKVVSNIYKTYPYTNGGGGDIQDSEVANSVTDDVIHFDHLLPGDYHVYAYANINATEWQKTGGDLIESKEKAVAADDSFSGYLNRELLSLTSAGTDVPADPSTSMLLTGHKTIPVGLSVVNETLDLTRPLVRFKVTVRNHTRFPVNVDELRFSHFNPDKAYLLDHRDASGVPSVPAGVTYRSMPAFDPSGDDDNSVAANAEEVIYQRLMYENVYSGVYKIYTTLTLDRSSETLDDLHLSLGDHPFGAIDLATLNEMDEGEQVDVLVVNPQISVRSGRILCYVNPSENNMVWESAGYENYNGFLNRALAIWNGVSDYDYSTRYSGLTNTNGYSGWDGFPASEGSEAKHFDYTGARSRYFHTLTKSNGTFSISGLALQQSNSDNYGKCLTAITGLTIEQGVSYKKNNVWKNPEDMSSKLVRFKKNTNDYIQCDALWSETKPNKLTNLKLFAGNQANGDRQFALFGKYMSGGLLKRILKHNNKEVPLTYMARNEEVNVVINVYYADQAGNVTFTVDNTHWTTAGATTSTHTFN